MTMREPSHILGMYLHLARASAARRQPMVRDKLLVLAGVTATEMGLAPIAAACRERVLHHNAWHLVRQWPSLAAAADDERFQSYLKQLRRRYSPEKAEHMLQSLGIELGRERAAYYTDQEYAEALLKHVETPAGSASSPQSSPVAKPDDAVRASNSATPLALWFRDWGPFALGVAVLTVLAVIRFYGR